MLRVVITGAALAVFLLASPFFEATANGNTVEPRDPRSHFFTPTFGDLNEEMQVARGEGKIGMLLFFEAEDCSYCKRMLKDVLSEPRVQDWYNERFVSIAVDIYGDVELTDFDGITLPSKVFTDHRQIFLTPVIAFIDLKGNEIYRHLGMIATPEEFLLLGEYIAGEHYYRMEFKTYAEQHNMRDEADILMTPARENE